MEKRKNTFWKKLGAIALEILGELAVTVMIFAIGAGIMALLGNADAVAAMDSELLILLGALVVLAGFGILFAVIAILRKIKRR